LRRCPGVAAFLRVANARRALALMAAAKFYPRQPRTIAAVTGTSGKTSVAAFTRQIWTALGATAPPASAPIGIVSPRGETYGSLTTPDPVALHRSLDALAGEGVTHLAIEASSHGLDQYRLDGLHIAAAGSPTSRAIISIIIRASRPIRRQAAAVRGPADAGRRRGHRCRSSTPTRSLPPRKVRGLSIVERRAQGDRHSSCRRKDRWLRAEAAARTRGKNFACACRWSANSRSRMRWSPPGLHRHRRQPDAVFAALEHLEGAKGRLELVGEPRRADFVDYAHKPDALAKALEALRPYVIRRLVVVFGAGGDRDRGKRPLMGAVAAERPTGSSSPTTIRAAKTPPPSAPRSCRRARRHRDRRPREAIRRRSPSCSAATCC
jgi:UDP-N-acetylmuramoyl-L-alanyl-D-glutamate--2,6-diaminopimelate ligase